MNLSSIQQKYGPWAVVTGASSGIGLEFCHQLASAKINLILVARRTHILQELGEYLSDKYGISYRVVSGDIGKPEVIDQIKYLGSKLEIGLLVSNAGTGNPGEFIHKEESQLLHTVQTSVVGHLQLSRFFGQKMASRKKGGIVLVSAMGADHGLPFMANDAGTRAYIRSLGLGLHEELKRYQVDVTVLITSPTETPIVKELGFQPEKMPSKPISTTQCVEETLAALMKNKTTIIPGRLYRTMNALIPKRVSRKLFAKMLAEGNNIPLKVT
ncbi:SDR family NAD(P)-dependent oxidoreductase [Marinoscillum furvescens]|uniref:Short-subunit dehydrogenase n=1 Tax=Marinoscillum furvescens DSM 4134 TaxID=1122208 RepID=A0A3D9L191_MARFU|nr:SDR family NAD(P)-dependent oxidoreductase [Marinoscillum furvescens]RED95257.1 hypothetical protein C7460_11834 [Marinoscillum furvescens DSM 4134]